MHTVSTFAAQNIGLEVLEYTHAITGVLHHNAGDNSRCKFQDYKYVLSIARVLHHSVHDKLRFQPRDIIFMGQP